MLIKYSKTNSNTFLMYRVTIRDGDTVFSGSRLMAPNASRELIARNLRNWRRSIFSAWRAMRGEQCQLSQ